MKFAKSSCNTFIIRLIRKEEVVGSIQRFCKQQEVKNAMFWGIGSIEDVTLAHYSVVNKKFSEKKFKGIFEIVSLLGNVSLFEDKPLVHSHISISNEEMKVYGGHLNSGTVSATAEIMVKVLESEYGKKMDDEIGLRLFDLPEEI